MAKLTLSPIAAFTQSAITTINQNMDDIETALEKTLSRDGTTPNQMTADLDLNDNDILNVDNLDVQGTLTLGGEIVIPGDISTGTATEILTAIKTVDGSGSGLDADLVDGEHASAFQHVGAAINDTSSVIASGAKFWNPLYYGNAGTAIVHRLNRLFVGEATHNSSDVGPVTTKSWLETLLDGGVSAAQLATTSATGQLANVGGSRSSDFRTLFASASGGSQGVTGIGHNDDTTPATTPISAGVVGIAFQNAGVNGIALNQMDANNKATAVTPTPSGGVTSGSVWALGLTSGAYSFATTNVTGALYIGRGSVAGPQFQKGIISFADALNPAIGAGGNGVTYEASRGQSFRWLNSGSTTDAEIWGAANGLISSKAIVPSANDGAALGVSGTAWSDLFLASGAVLNFNNGDVLVTHAANQLQFTLASNGYVFDAVIAPTANDGAALGTGSFSWSDVFLASGGVINFANGNYAVTHSSNALTFSGTGGNQFALGNTASSVNWIQAVGAVTTGSPLLSAVGSDTNVSMALATKGTGLYDFFTNGTVRQFRVYDTPSAVNYVQLSGSATGAAATFAVVGADAAVSMSIVAKTTGSIFINSGSSRSAEFQSPASSVNNMLINGAIATAGPLMITSGSDTNITGILRGKGTGGFDLQDGGSTSKFKYNTTGIGFFNATPVARGAQAALTGTIQRGTFDTATVTLPQLAGVVMAIVADLRAYGLSS